MGFIKRTECMVLCAGLIIYWAAGLSFSETSENASEAERISSGLAALYDFRDGQGAMIYDRSGANRPINLKINNLEAVRRAPGSLEVLQDTRIVSDTPPEEWLKAIQWSGRISIEAWVKPANIDQKGPARIVTLSQNSGNRNFTLGQDGSQFQMRLRTTGTSNNGIPAVDSGDKTLSTEKTHVVYTRSRSGRARFYINGNLVEEEQIPGELSNWDSAFQFSLANELDGGRPWHGTYYLLAIYNRDLLPHEVKQNYRAGTELKSTKIHIKNNKSARLFVKQVAPLLVQRCFECHDTVNQEGGLDLTNKKTAFAGGKGGPAIVPGQADQSPLYTMLEYDLMPYERTPLSAEEKQLIREWIDSGAEWTMESIDPTLYAHGYPDTDIWVRRLTVNEYINTVNSAVGVDIAEEAEKLLPGELRADGFSNTAYNLNVDFKHIQAFAQLAELIVERMDVLEFARRFTKSDKLTDDNMRGLIADMGKWLLRGPLEGPEIDIYRGISTTAASTGGDFEEAVASTIKAMLQSPRFLYRIENQRGDGTRWPVNQYELASRLSYLVWGAPPDQALFKAAEKGELYTQEEIERQVQRMLNDPRAETRSLQFISEWLNLPALENLQPSPEKFPNWDSKLAADMRQETLAFFKHVVWELNRPLADLFNAQFTYLTARLAQHYGLEPTKHNAEVPSDQLLRYNLSNIPSRGGLLTQGSVLTKGGDEASTVTRGLFVLHDVLRGSVQDPPPDVDTTPIPTEPGLTQRRIAEQRIANPACGGCHKKFEPLSFGLSKFDGLGTYHERDEHGNKLRNDGEVLIPGQAEPLSYKNTAEFMNLLASSERVRQTITWKLAQFTLGRPLGPQDAPMVNRIHKNAQKQGGTYKALITAIAVSDLVRSTQTEVYP